MADNTCWLLPIEPLEERYSAQWLAWFPAHLNDAGWRVRVVAGLELPANGATIRHGEFLDVHGTHFYKAHQLAQFAAALEAGEVQDGDVVLLLDAWNPAVLSLAYMRDLGRVRFKLAGCLHAGAYDPHDLLGQHPTLPRWAAPAERGMFAALDAVFVATAFHAQLLKETRNVEATVTGFPMYDDAWAQHAQPWSARPRRVVWPHRLAPEKNPAAFAALERAYRNAYPGDVVEWVRTKDVCKSKSDYYRLLGSSRVAVSTAFQETWGIAMLEAASLGCHPVVPSRLSYPDVYRTTCEDEAAFVRAVHAGLNAEAAHEQDMTPWRSAIERIGEEMRGLT